SGTPVGEECAAGARHDVRVPGDVPDVEQPDGGDQVRRGDLAAPGEAAYGVVDVEARVPQRVPERAGERGDRGEVVAPAVVQEERGEAGRRAGVAAPLGDHDGEREAGVVAGHGAAPERGEGGAAEAREPGAVGRPVRAEAATRP